MPQHPPTSSAPAEAWGLVRAALAHPDDRLRRLVLADWLEERGGDSDAAWAEYLRAQAELETCDDGRRTELVKLSIQQQRRIHARLTLPARAVASRFRHLSRLLPSGNIAIRLGEAEVPVAVLELFPESVARENAVVPLSFEGNHLAIAAAMPHADLIDKLEFVLARRVTAFVAEQVEVLDAINRHYGSWIVESMDCFSYESPLIGLDGHGLFALFLDCFRGRFTGFTCRRPRSSAWTEYFDAGEQRGHAPLTRAGYNLLLAHLMSLESEVESVDEHRPGIERLVDLPLLSGRPCPIRFERDPGRRTSWFRVTFLWGL